MIELYYIDYSLPPKEHTFGHLYTFIALRKFVKFQFVDPLYSQYGPKMLYIFFAVDNRLTKKVEKRNTGNNL